MNNIGVIGRNSSTGCQRPGRLDAHSARGQDGGQSLAEGADAHLVVILQAIDQRFGGHPVRRLASRPAGRRVDLPFV